MSTQVDVPREKKRRRSKSIWRKKDNREELKMHMWKEAQVVVSDRRKWRTLLHSLRRASLGHGRDKAHEQEDKYRLRKENRSNIREERRF